MASFPVNQRLAAFIMRGRLPALLVASVLGGFSIVILPLTIFVGATVGLVTLRRGLLAALLPVGGALMCAALTAYFGYGKPVVAVPLLIAVCLPVCVCAQVLRVTHSQGTALLLVGGCAALFAVGMRIVTGDVVSWWELWLSANVSLVPGATMEGFELDGALILMNGFVTMLLGIHLIASMLIARWWQALLYNPGGFRKEFHALRLWPKLAPLAVLLAVVVLSKIIVSGIIVDLFFIAVMMYMFQGLAVAHAIVLKRDLSPWWLVIPYICLFRATPLAMLALAAVGVVDGSLDLRKRCPVKIQQ